MDDAHNSRTKRAVVGVKVGTDNAYTKIIKKITKLGHGIFIIFLNDWTLFKLN